MQIAGKILWWNDRDGFGVIEDAHGNEYYFDSSVVAARSLQSLKRKQVVTFQRNKGVSDCLCACKVKVATAAERKRLETTFDNRQLRLDSLA